MSDVSVNRVPRDQETSKTPIVIAAIIFACLVTVLITNAWVSGSYDEEISNLKQKNVDLEKQVSEMKKTLSMHTAKDPKPQVPEKGDSEKGFVKHEVKSPESGKVDGQKEAGKKSGKDSKASTPDQQDQEEKLDFSKLPIAK